MSDLASITINESCDLLDLSCHMTGISDFFTSLGLWFYESIVFGLASLLESIPLPDFLTQMSSYTLPDVVAWAAAPFMLSYGVGIIGSAYTLRFIIRRLPFIG